jgi:hypothetical protein
MIIALKPKDKHSDGIRKVNDPWQGANRSLELSTSQKEGKNYKN